MLEMRVGISKSLSRQAGAVMVIALIMLLLMMIVGLSAVRGTNMQEIMVGNMRDRNISFQISESGLRFAEATLDGLTDNPLSGNGVWRDLNVADGIKPSSVSIWTKDDWELPNNSIEVDDASLKDLPGKPRYVIERLAVPLSEAAAAEGSCVGVGCMQTVPAADFYRTTTRGTGQSGTSEVVIQSVTKIPPF